MKKRIYAVVLAAGMSTRMGRPKQLLPFGEKTVLQTVVDTLLSVDLDGVFVVLGHDAKDIRESLSGRPVEFCVNSSYRDGMFSSILCGLNELPEKAGAMLLALGDQPQIERSVAAQVVEAYRAGGVGIVIPVVQGERGHPVLIDVERYGLEISKLSGDMGLKPVVRGHPEDTLELAVEDEEILRDMDTPEDYQSELDRLNNKKNS